MSDLIDISPVVSPRLAVFPGDTPFSREILLDMARGDHITLSTIRATLHLGAHADAVSHYAADGDTIDRMALDLYIGPCRVIRAAAGSRGAAERRVAVEDLGGAPIDAPRILLATGTAPDADRWSPEFAGLEPALVDHLTDRGVRLVGIDTPSVDPADSKDLPGHARCRERRVAIVEGLRLEGVAPGLYEFIGLPLRLEGCDASPIRAVLRRPLRR